MERGKGRTRAHNTGKREMGGGGGKEEWGKKDVIITGIITFLTLQLQCVPEKQLAQGVWHLLCFFR